MTDEPRNGAVQARDEDLVRRYTSGEDPEVAFKELFRRYGPLTYAFFRRRIGNEAVASEQNQELYLSVITHLEKFRGDCSFRSWLFCLAHNRLMQWRRRMRVHAEEVLEEVSEPLLGEFLGATRKDHPEAQAVSAQRRRKLLGCLARLSEVERTVVYGQYYRGTTLRELTSMLGMDNPSGARASLIAAQRKLRRCLELAGVTGGSDGGTGARR